MPKINILKKEDKCKNLGDKICRFVEYHELKNRYAPILQLAALADILVSIKEIFRSYDKRFEKLEEHLKDKERMMVNK